MAGKKNPLMEEYKTLLADGKRHSYSQKRAAFHLAKISTMDNLIRQNAANTKSQKECAEVEAIIKREVKKYGACQSRKKESEK